jgi:hypothetical protein
MIETPAVQKKENPAQELVQTVHQLWSLAQLKKDFRTMPARSAVCR